MSGSIDLCSGRLPLFHAWLNVVQTRRGRMKGVDMRRHRMLALAVLGAGLTAACNDSTSPGEESFEWTGQIAPGNRIEIKGVNGSILANGTAASDVVVSARKTSQQSEVTEVQIEVLQHAQGVTICAVYPDVPGQPPNTCLPGEQGTMNVQDNDVAVAFDVGVPTGVIIVGRTVNGDVSADDVEGNGFLSTVNGNVRVSTSGLAEAMTINGSVDASIGLADWDRDLGFSSVNGSVAVTIPASTNAEVRLSTVNGSIVSDFPLTEVSPRNFQGTVGSGGRILAVSTVNGNVALGRSP